jgi:hypothetical protein
MFPLTNALSRTIMELSSLQGLSYGVLFSNCIATSDESEGTVV